MLLGSSVKLALLKTMLILHFLTHCKYTLVTKWYQNGTSGTLRHSESDFKEVCPILSWFVQVCPWFVLVRPGLGI